MDNDPYADTDRIKVVVTPTLIIPAYQVKRKKKQRDWRMRIALAAIIISWLLLMALSAFLAWAIVGYAHGGFN